MLRSGANLKLGVPMFLAAFVASAVLLYGGAQLVKQDAVAADGGPAGPDGGPAIVTIVSQNIRFNPNTITATAGLDVTVTHENRDAGVPHDMAFFTSRAATQQIYASTLITGPDSETFTFQAPSAPGNYFFRCNVHPDQMTGAFVVR